MNNELCVLAYVYFVTLYIIDNCNKKWYIGKFQVISMYYEFPLAKNYKSRSEDRTLDS